MQNSVFQVSIGGHTATYTAARNTLLATDVARSYDGQLVQATFHLKQAPSLSQLTASKSLELSLKTRRNYRIAWRWSNAIISAFLEAAGRKFRVQIRWQEPGQISRWQRHAPTEPLLARALPAQTKLSVVQRVETKKGMFFGKVCVELFNILPTIHGMVDSRKLAKRQGTDIQQQSVHSHTGQLPVFARCVYIYIYMYVCISVYIYIYISVCVYTLSE